MHPIITTLHVGEAALPIASYGVMLTLALWVGALGTLLTARKHGMELGALISALGLVIAGGFFGALLSHSLAQLARGGAAFALSEGPGLSVLGALLFGMLTLVLVATRLGLQAPLLLDLAVPWVALAQALGRIGCWLGGCCYGVESSGFLAVNRHPVPLYEALALLVLAAFFFQRFGLRPSLAASRTVAELRSTLASSKLAGSGRWRVGSGLRAASYLALYALLRIALEPLRGDAVRGVFLDGAVSTAQILSCAVLAGAIGFMGLRVNARAQRSWVALGCALLLGMTLVALLAPLRASAERFEDVPRSLAPIARIEAGTFVMGSDEADIAFAIELCKRYLPASALCDAARFSDEQPARLVQLPAFAIDRTEVTNAAYRRCALHGACATPRVPETDARSGLDAQPVVMVSAAEAEAYCAFVGGRLPSEAEWERAARAGTARRFPWGNTWNNRLSNHGQGDAPSGEVAAQAAVTRDAAQAAALADGFRYAAPVGALADGKNPHGLLDMAGNVWELTADYYASYAPSYAPSDTVSDAPASASAARAQAPVIRPSGPERGELRVIRGGSYATPPHQLRATQRASVPDAEPRPDVGFRCAYRATAK